MMLVHIGQPDVAERVHNAWLRTIEEGIHTYDIYNEGVSREKVGTRDFTQAVIDRLGQQPEHLAPVAYAARGAGGGDGTIARATSPRAERALVGIDVFLHADDITPDSLAARLLPAAGDGQALRLEMISNRGTKVWPGGFPETFCTDHWRCRFTTGAVSITNQEAIALQQRIDAAGLEIIKTENLYTFDGVPGYSLGQGQ